MNAASATMTTQAIEQHCKLLRLPTVGAQFETLAQQALRENQTPISYLDALLSAEVEDREKRTIERRLREARLPRLKTLEEFDFTQTKAVTAPRMVQLAEGGYIERSEPILFLGDCGTGKTHLMTGLCVAACRQKRRVRFTTAAVEKDIYRRVEAASGARFVLTRLAIHARDIGEFNLPPQKIKGTDSRAAGFRRAFGDDASTVELDALPADELRRRIDTAVDGLVDHDQWNRDLRVQEVEYTTIADVVGRVNAALN